MSRYRIEDVVVDTDNAQESWEEATRWNGNNHISRATGSQWEHETLYRSARGRYYVVHTSQYQGTLPWARFLTEAEAAAWLLANEEELPDDLEKYAAEVSE
jgi:hypothetical protein